MQEQRGEAGRNYVQGLREYAEVGALSISLILSVLFGYI